MQEVSSERAAKKTGVVIFDSRFGNTKKVAESLAAGMSTWGIEVNCVSMKEVRPQDLASYDLIAVGAPTQYRTASETAKTFLKTLGSVNMKGKYGFAFDTRRDSFFAGSAAEYIEKQLRKSGLNIIMAHSSAIIYTSTKEEQKDKEARRASARLIDGEEQRFTKVGEQLGRVLDASSTRATA